MAITTEEVKKLASLSRIAVSDEEVEALRDDMESILKYVEEINTVSLGDSVEVGPLQARKNVFRNDEELNVSGEYTEKLIANMPASEGNYLKVKKIL
jgi:aspartyl-tRNA(Asn)/glutamyl-tRNA(Gln) amidotransferase subunit C